MTEDKAAAALLRERSKIERLRCFHDIETILDAKRCALRIPWGYEWSDAARLLLQRDHSQSFRTKNGIFVFDNPYPRREGGVQLPRYMSFYIAEECSPRLLAPPKSSVNLERIRDLLIKAGFKGNYCLTRNPDR